MPAAVRRTPWRGWPGPGSRRGGPGRGTTASHPCGVARDVRREVERRDAEDLEHGRERAGVPGLETGGRSEAAAGGEAPDRDRGAVPGHPRGGVVALVLGHGEGDVGPSPEVDVDHAHPGLGRDVPAPEVVHLRVAHQPGAAVQVDVRRASELAVHVDRHVPVARGRPQPARRREVGAREAEVVAVAHGEARRRVQQRRSGEVGRAPHLDASARGQAPDCAAELTVRREAGSRSGRVPSLGGFETVAERPPQPPGWRRPPTTEGGGARPPPLVEEVARNRLETW